MAVIKKDQGPGRLLRNILDVRDELLQLTLAVKVVIPHRGRDIEPIGISTMKSKITDLGRGPWKVRHQLR